MCQNHSHEVGQDSFVVEEGESALHLYLNLFGHGDGEITASLHLLMGLLRYTEQKPTILNFFFSIRTI